MLDSGTRKPRLGLIRSGCTRRALEPTVATNTTIIITRAAADQDAALDERGGPFTAVSSYGDGGSLPVETSWTPIDSAACRVKAHPLEATKSPGDVLRPTRGSRRPRKFYQHTGITRAHKQSAIGTLIGPNETTRRMSAGSKALANSLMILKAFAILCHWWVRTAGGVNLWAHSRALSSHFQSHESPRRSFYRCQHDESVDPMPLCRGSWRRLSGGVRAQYGSRGSHKALETYVPPLPVWPIADDDDLVPWIPVHPEAQGT